MKDSNLPILVKALPHGSGPSPPILRTLQQLVLNYDCTKISVLAIWWLEVFIRVPSEVYLKVDLRPYLTQRVRDT